jgi:hypothetical protein
MLKLTTLLLDHNELKHVPQGTELMTQKRKETDRFLRFLSALLDMKVVRISLDGNPFGEGMENTIK